ncbi:MULTISPECIES: ABC transporter permease [Halocynthiibacter]|uniref:ABC transporter permease n=1 Tax=Halocynthiibacter halioticoli TaxID=2986804 RepID=A0AAE3J2I4_9RHOB|nr:MULTISPECIES: ABC transporter permease [Halocynthiibacter]MCV6825650.1 ABC transporter permease [Halocynthiibacter halioticoli]MCW4058651.1 ABC transporter permease [Halocynthiibacter sp. SDUM655004]
MTLANQISSERRFKFCRTVFALILREMATTYGRSPGGYVWAFLEPLAGITLLSLVFSIAFNAPPLGSSFPLFYASGFLPFLYYTEVSQKLAAALRFSRPLLFYPTVTFWDAICARLILTVLTNAVVMIVIFYALISLETGSPNLRPIHLLNAFLMTTALGFGVGVMNCFLIMASPLWERLWGIANKPLFIISGVLFLIDDVPDKYADLLAFNPIVHIVGEARKGIYSNYTGNYVNSIFVYGLSMTLLALGIMLLRRFHKHLLNNG